MKHISIDEFDATIVGADGFTDTSMFDPEQVVQELEQEIEAEKKNKDAKDDPRRRIEMLREHKNLNVDLADAYDDFLNS